MDKKKITVFIQDMKGDEWLGGKNYYENLEKIVTSHYPEISFRAFDFMKSEPAPVVRVSLFSRIIRKFFPGSAKPVPRPSKVPQLKQLAGDSQIVIFSGHSIQNIPGLPFIFWIPDFQFLHLPEIASEKHVEWFRNNIRKGSEIATLVMLSSLNGLKDFKSFLPEYIGKAHVVPFAKKIAPEFLDIDIQPLLGKYHLPERFFYLPNQFWKHKNHQLVLEALAILKKEGKCPFVVFSGYTSDFRHPGHFETLLKFVSENNLRDHVAFLGVIPFPDVIGLIRLSVAVINPSLFEGWSTTVEEVKSIGKKMLLSDLDVHKEQDPENAVFFPQKDAQVLAKKMTEVFAATDPVKDRQYEKEALQRYSKKENEFAANFRQLIDTAIQLSGNK
ncbi:MAG TPA: glycosyltransferase family 1 protein [Bacteroidia bacterium]|nr:glycosyltransferase family 1 protein [Bacteroidia bacterium]